MMHTSSNQDLVARLAEVLKAQPMENLPVSKSISPICSPLAGEIALLCPKTFAPGSIQTPSLEQQQEKQTEDNVANFARRSSASNTEASVSVAKLEEHDCDQTIGQAAKENHVDSLGTIHQGSLIPKVKLARKNMEEKKPQESIMVSVKSGNYKRLCLCGQVSSLTVFFKVLILIVSQVGSGKMVQCENPTCAYGWCHYSCVQVLNRRKYFSIRLT